MKRYEVIVIGAGHAGIEAAMASARMQKDTALITISKDMMGSMPCNPSVGGPAKGIVVREIDAMGGLMPKVADKTALQFKMLNTTKGPGVWSLRVQSDKEEYKKEMKKILLNTHYLQVIEGVVHSIIIEDGKAKGVRMTDGEEIFAKAVILTTGTYMTSSVLRGHTAIESGPEDQITVNTLSESLRQAGVETFRLKTGTPPRIKKDTIDFSKTSVQPGTDDFIRFSESTQPEDVLSFEEQEVCHLIYTTPKTHQIINDHLTDSAMYSGLVKGVGPRYCPSIEDKLVRFADKERHQLFLEPESRSLDTIYVQGFSTSMPIEVQEEMVHSLPGLENCVIEKYAYAIEYDAINPLQMKPNMENKVVENLFTAGQVNGTSGYEEAAGQGLMAGVNAALKIEGKEPFVLRRDEAYIGVMIDDLCTKGTNEPYRLLTSRAEYRLLLRHDNADQRLTQKAYHVGLVDLTQYIQFQEKMDAIEEAKEELAQTHIKPGENVNAYLATLGFDPLAHGCSALDLVKRPKVTIEGLAPITGKEYPKEVAQEIEIDVKYAGYIEKAKRDAKHLQQMDSVKLPKDIDYQNMDNLSLEARQKLSQIQPTTLGQASRISGINPSDIAILAARVKS
ncbi:MAG: tRNA uridine-5-carboxymethylaminomethyl(34) synthesis enzyme MnmG [Bacillota bacterium]|nr:tRNA uridine-5-carboxymethylaminomethyl(34) synthesis enzyme MnmG [Bacillota bacterium]